MHFHDVQIRGTASGLRRLAQETRANVPEMELKNNGEIQSSGMLRRVVLVRTDVSKDRIASIIRATIIFELETTLTITSNRSTLRRNFSAVCLPVDSCHPHDGGDTFSGNIGSYKSYATSHSIGRKSSESPP
jgi:hypothetical protein